MYTPAQVATVFREIRKALTSNPFVFSKQGVFRVPGAQSESRAIVQNILSGGKIKVPSQRNMEKFPIHDYISALKLVFDESVLLNPNALSVEILKDSIIKNDLAQAGYELNQFVEQLINSIDEHEHAAGEVLYTYFQLTTLALTFQDKNKMNAQNLGIVLGPNFEKLINNNPVHTLPLILKLNSLCEDILITSQYNQDFETKHAPAIILAKEQKVTQLKQQRSSLKNFNQIYEDKIKEYKTKIAAQKVAFSNASFADRKLIKSMIVDCEKTIEIYENDGKENRVKLKDLKLQIKELEAELKSLKKKYPPELKKSATDLKGITTLLGEIKALISDDEGEMELSPIMPKNVLMRLSGSKNKDLSKMALKNQDCVKEKRKSLRKSNTGI